MAPDQETANKAWWALKSFQLTVLEHQIAATPTGEVRNLLTDLNICVGDIADKLHAIATNKSASPLDTAPPLGDTAISGAGPARQ